MAQPHDNWARFYDFVYQQTFGPVYKQLCEDTEDVCQQLVQYSPGQGNSAYIMDVGAGTGRVTIPLLQQGHCITAVEPSQPMCEQIQIKAETMDETLRKNLKIIQKPMQHTNIQVNYFDIALCVFTVIAYIVKEESLRQAIQNIADSLKQNGLLLLDIPQRRIFESMTIQKGRLSRQIEITQINETNTLYDYKECCHGEMNGEHFEYSDSFQIRQWSDKEVIKICRDNGLVEAEIQAEVLNGKFCNTGAEYYLFKKQ